MRRDAAGTETDIEFLPPDSRAFGESGQVDFVGFDGDAAAAFEVDDEPRSRWLTAVAAAVVGGFIAIGVVVAAPWAEDAVVAPPTTTTATTTATVTAPVPALDIMEGVPVSPQGWVVDDPPAGLQFSGAWSNQEVTPRQPLEIWVERPDAPAAGRWLTVRWNDAGVAGFLVGDGTRFVVGDRAAVASTDANGVTVVRARAGDASIEIRSSGVAFDDLAALVGAVQRGSTNSGITYVTDTALAATDGLTAVWDRSTPTGWFGAFGAFDAPEATTGLYDPANGSGMQIERRLVDQTLLPYLAILATEVPLADDVAAAMEAIGRPTRLFSVAPNADERWLVAAWVDGDEAVTISAYDLDEDTVLAAMSAVRPATLAEWTDLVEQSQRGISLNEPGPSPSASQRGTLADGSVWTGSFAETFFWVQTGQNGWYSPIRIADGATIRRFADVDIDIVAATVRWPNPARTMRITTGDAAPVDIELVQIGKRPMFAGLYVRQEIGPIGVELLDADGNVVPAG
ncbi:MAG: hypothetical protein WD023_07995 [Ilumatobacteraceae bacterium]